MQAWRDLRDLVRSRPDVSLAFRHFPLDTSCNPHLQHSMHPDACLAACAAECAAQQGRFWEYHDVLFANHEHLERDNLFRFARELGLDIPRFRTCLDDPATKERVVADVDAVFPGSSFELNTEMSQILSAFNAATAVEKTMRLLEQTKIYEEHFAYRYNLRSVTDGWTPEWRRIYFKWFNEEHGDDQHRYDYREWFNRVNQQPRIAGNAPYLNQVRTAALATLTDAEKADAELAAILAAYKAPAPGRGGRGPATPVTPPAGGRGDGRGGMR
jgi:hypothetical protein